MHSPWQPRCSRWGAAAVMFLHAVPADGDDIMLEAARVLADAVMGAVGGLATRLRPDR